MLQMQRTRYGECKEWTEGTRGRGWLKRWHLINDIGRRHYSELESLSQISFYKLKINF